MRSPKIANTTKRGILKSLMIICYFPLSFCLIGILAYLSRIKDPINNSYALKDVFWFYANPLQVPFRDIHLPALAFCFAFLLWMVTLVNTPKPIITLFQIRIILLVLIATITILVKIFFNILLVSPIRMPNLKEHIFIPLFLYVDVHLVLLFLLTYLPFFRRLNIKLLER